MDTIKKDSNEYNKDYNKDNSPNKSPDKSPDKDLDKGKEQETNPNVRFSAKLGMQQNAKHNLPKEDGKNVKQDNRADVTKEGEQNENGPKGNRGR